MNSKTDLLFLLAMMALMFPGSPLTTLSISFVSYLESSCTHLRFCARSFSFLNYFFLRNIHPLNFTHHLKFRFQYHMSSYLLNILWTSGQEFKINISKIEFYFLILGLFLLLNSLSEGQPATHSSAQERNLVVIVVSYHFLILVISLSIRF